MSARLPSTVTMSLEEFARHGGLVGPHKDGWGVAWYEEGEVHLSKESLSASSSAVLSHLLERPFLSDTVLCHIRKATQGTVATRNCQPFVRELGGRWLTFAHNGDLPGLREAHPLPRRGFRPVGETDSEWAFCVLLERLLELWNGPDAPGLEQTLAVVHRFAEAMRLLGPANFLFSDGMHVVAHSHKRHQSDGTIRAPGLWRLTRHCEEGGALLADGLSITARGVAQDVVLYASVPLTQEHWAPLPEGTVSVAHRGTLLPAASA